jgi:hypothetical protein
VIVYDSPISLLRKAARKVGDMVAHAIAVSLMWMWGKR